MKAKTILFAGGLLITGGITYSMMENKTYNMKSIDEFLMHEVERGRTPGIQYAFFDINSIIYERNYGLRNVKSKSPVDSLTTYNIFSVTKTFTALAVLQLVQAGKIKLNASASDYLPGFPYPGKITVEHLLNHSSGIPNPLPLRWIHLASEHETFNRDLFFNEVFRSNSDLDAEPGTKFKYSNLGYVLLGQLIENVSGQTYEDYVRENIIKPCGITTGTLGFEIDPAFHATGYQKWWSFGNALIGFMIDKKIFMGPKEGQWKPFVDFYTNGTSYGGMIGSGSALIRYAQTLLRRDSLLLNDDFKKILFTESILNNKATGMSLSWYTGTLKGHSYYAHAGGGGGYYVELRLYPELGTGSVILFNRSGMKDERILDKADSFFLKQKQ